MKKNYTKLSVLLVAVLILSGVSSSNINAQEMNTTMVNGSMMAESNLWVGSRGAAVISLQNFLEEKGHLNMPNGVAKGYFGNLTKKALMRYQTSVGVRGTGYFGPLTRAKMMANLGMSDGVMVGGSLMVRSLDIVDNAVKANNVTTVVAAVKAAGLVDTLKSEGPFTVFAPTNNAFAKLPAGTVDTLLKVENKAQLTSILTYHVVAGRYTKAELTNGLTLKTVQGQNLTFTKDANGKLWINGSAMIETADVISKNGVTHVIDSVLMPK